MRFRDQVALTLPSFFLRLMLAVIFIWAGLGKLVQTVDVPPQQAARLATIGVPVPAAAPAPKPAETPAVRLPEPEAAEPAPMPESDEAPAPEAEGDDTQAAPDEQLPDPDGGSAALAPPPTILRPASFLQDGGTTRSLADRRPPAGDPPAEEPADETEPTEPETSAPETPVPAPTPAPTPAEPAPAAPAFTAADFPNGASVRKVVLLALVMDRAANPPLDAESNQPEPFWPQALAQRPWPHTLAWAVALTELIGGVLMLLGLLTRLGALGLASVMLGAMWLTQIGPAIQADHTVLGFLPAYGRFDVEAWQPLLWQFSLLAASLAVFLLGSGAIGLDRALFRGSRYHAYNPGPSYTPAGEFNRPPREPKP